MERSLVDWLLLKGEKEDNWVLEFLKNLSDNGLHITLESLINFLKLNIKDGGNENSIFLLLKELDSIHSKESHKTEFIYSRSHTSLHCNQRQTNKPLITCFDIIRNNKKLLIKKENNFNLIYSEESGELFIKKVWRNNYLKNEIIFYLSIYRTHRFKNKVFSSIEEFQKYRFRNFLNEVQFSFNGIYNESVVNHFLEFQLPSSIRKIRINSNQYIPYGVSKLTCKEFPYTGFIKPFSISSSITHIDFDCSTNMDFQVDTKFIEYNHPILKSDLFFKNNNDDNKEVYKNIIFYSYISTINDGAIPEGVESISFDIKSDLESNLLNQFPKSLKTLYLSRSVYSDKVPLKLPTSITTLVYDINCIIEPHFLPNSITDLSLFEMEEFYFQDKLKVGILPPNLVKLNLGGYCNEIDPNILPQTLKQLTLCQRYNKTIKPECLPNLLESLSFHGNIGPPPSQQQNNIKTKISNLFKKHPERKQPVLIEGSLPIGLKYLKLSTYQSFLDILVPNVITESHRSLLKISIFQDQIYDINGNKQLSNDEITLKVNDWKKLKFQLPTNIKIIKLYSTNYQLPSLLFKEEEEEDEEEEDSLPFTHFKSSSSIILQIKKFPNSLKSISFNDQYDYLNDTEDIQILKYPLPNSLIKLNLGFNNFIKYSNQFILKDLHLNSLKVLCLSIYFSDEELNIGLNFPNLETLVVGNSNPKLILSQSKNSLKEILVYPGNQKFLDNNIQLYPLIKIFKDK
ncbi:hypothetical protein ACTA71_000367 [Dictyostelium dimigraforme]